jgi:hypothetical protein
VCSLDGARAWKCPEPTKWAAIVTILRRYYELATSIDDTELTRSIHYLSGYLRTTVLNFITVSHGSREGVPPVEATARRATELL